MDNIREAINQAVKNGRLDILMDFHRKYKNQCPWNEETCITAALNGHIECLKYAHENGCPWDDWTCLSSAKNNHLECLKYAHKNGCPWDNWVCYWAAKYGHLECLKYAHENGCPWNDLTCAEAAKNGHLECLKYAHENGCLWYRESNTCPNAAANGHLDCLEYAHKNGCPYPNYLLKFIVRKILIPKWRASVKVRFIIFYWMELGARTSCAENGRARIEDINSFENDFNNLVL